MKAEQLNPFITALVDILGQYGITGIDKQSVELKDEMIITQDVTAFIGIVGDFSGNISYCYSQETAKNLASAMMMGMPVEVLDDMSSSALAELSNQITGTAATIFSNQKVQLDITPPSLVVGEEMMFILTFLKTICLSFTTSVGLIEVNVALEV